MSSEKKIALNVSLLLIALVIAFIIIGLCVKCLRKSKESTQEVDYERAPLIEKEKENDDVKALKEKYVKDASKKEVDENLKKLDEDSKNVDKSPENAGGVGDEKMEVSDVSEVSATLAKLTSNAHLIYSTPSSELKSQSSISGFHASSVNTEPKTSVLPSSNALVVDGNGGASNSKENSKMRNALELFLKSGKSNASDIEKDENYIIIQGFFDRYAEGSLNNTDASDDILMEFENGRTFLQGYNRDSLNPAMSKEFDQFLEDINYVLKHSSKKQDEPSQSSQSRYSHSFLDDESEAVRSFDKISRSNSGSSTGSGSSAERGDVMTEMEEMNMLQRIGNRRFSQNPHLNSFSEERRPSINHVLSLLSQNAENDFGKNLFDDGHQDEKVVEILNEENEENGKKKIEGEVDKRVYGVFNAIKRIIDEKGVHGIADFKENNSDFKVIKDFFEICNQFKKDDKDVNHVKDIVCMMWVRLDNRIKSNDYKSYKNNDLMKGIFNELLFDATEIKKKIVALCKGGNTEIMSATQVFNRNRSAELSNVS